MKQLRGSFERCCSPSAGRLSEHLSTQLPATAHAFTLLEMVLAISISGVIFLGLAGFVAFASRGYMDAVVRQQVQHQARFVLEKMSRDIRAAAPHSVQINDDQQGEQCLSFFPIEQVGRYRRDLGTQQVDFVIDNQGSRLHFNKPLSLVVAPHQPSDYQPNSGHSFSLAGCVDKSDQRCFERVLAEDSWLYTTLDRFERHDPRGQYYLYSEPVAYCVAQDGLVSKNGVTIAQGVDWSQSGFSYQAGTGLVHIRMRFSYGDESSFYHQIVRVLHEE